MFGGLLSHCGLLRLLRLFLLFGGCWLKLFKIRQAQKRVESFRHQLSRAVADIVGTLELALDKRTVSLRWPLLDNEEVTICLAGCYMKK